MTERFHALPASEDETRALLERGCYVADDALVTALYLSFSLGRPLLLEGEAGCGKTELAGVLAETLGRRLLRLQCHEGLDVAAAVYEWNYAAQMLAIRLAESGASDRDALAEDVFAERFLIKRPLLTALEPHPFGAPVLLIDEIDRADPPFEAYLLEVLSDFQVSVPEFGTVQAKERPIVVITSNRTREVHDALKRRCLYHWIDYPDAEREKAILRARLPGIEQRLSDNIVAFIERMRAADLSKVSGLQEVIAWSSAVIDLDRVELDPATVQANLDRLLAYQRQLAEASGKVPRVARELDRPS
jgi:MoxR-like ATPase